MADNKGVVLGLSIVGAFFAAAASRSSRRRVLEQRRSRALDAPQNGHAPPGGEWVPPTLVLQPQPESRPPRGGAGAYALLLLHGIASVVLLALAPAYKPPSLTEEAWKQIFGSFLILALTLHAAVVVLWRTNAATAPPVAAVPVSASAASQGRLHDVDALVGVWLKDKELSDSMDPVCDLMSIHGIIRMAIGLIKGVEIEVVLGAEGREFKFAVLSGVLWFKIRERYVLSGPEVRHRRRDMRGGEVEVHKRVCPQQNGPPYAA